MGCRTRTIGSVFPESDGRVYGRGNISFTSINLPRIAIKHGIVTGERNIADIDGFYKEFDEKIELVIGQLLERFELQCSKKVKNFPFLMEQGIWMNAEKLNPEDTIREIIKHGTLTAGFIGLAESLKALIGEHHGESEKAQKLGLEIIGHLRKRMDEASKKYNLNFSVIGTPKYSGRLYRNI
jgi:ribonucleoside-triphosphate reductase